MTQSRKALGVPGSGATVMAWLEIGSVVEIVVFPFSIVADTLSQLYTMPRTFTSREVTITNM